MMMINLAGARRAGRFLVLTAAVFGLMLAGTSSAGTIAPGDILGIPSGTIGSGNGTLDLRLMTFSGSEIDNNNGGFDGDNAVSDLPQGGENVDTQFFDESYVTTAGELQSYYTLNYGATTTGQIELTVFLDLNETGVTGEANNSLSKFDVILNPATINADDGTYPNPDPTGDVIGAEQTAINQDYTSDGGTVVSATLSSTPLNLPIIAMGAGWADYAILTGIDPFALSASDVVLFNISMGTLNNGSEEVFLSGTYSGQDVIDAQVPEPSTAILLILGLASLAVSRRRR